MEINASHFKTMEELIRHINMCVREEDIFALERYVGLNELDILVKEIARLNKIIDEIDRISTTNYQTNIYTGSIDFKRGYNEGSKFFQEFLRNKLKELKEEGKFQEIPLFEGTMEQLDNLTILKEEGKE
jgi:hypothetical protein